MTSTSMDLETVRLRARVRFLRALGTGIARAITHLIATTRRSRARRATLRQLRELEDWQLTDIGLDRSSVDAELMRHGLRPRPSSLRNLNHKGA